MEASPKDRLADAYDIGIKFEKAETRTRGEKKAKAVSRTRGERVKLTFGIERKTRIENQSSQDINVIVSDRKVAITRSTKTTAGVDTRFVKVCAEVGGERTVEPPPCQEDVILAGDSEEFELDQKTYYLTVFTKDKKNNIVVHMKNRRVLAKQNIVFEEKDLKKHVVSL